MSDGIDYTLYPDAHVEERVRYFSGQFLDVQDFVDEQRYILDRLRRSLHGLAASGVATGLEVTSPTKGKLRVAAGTAMDGSGRQLVLAQNREAIDIPDALKGKTIDVRIYYREVEARPQGGENGGPTRIHESPGIELIQVGTQPKEVSGVPLARIQVRQDGVCTFHEPDPVRKYAGISFPTSSQEHPVLRSGAPARPDTLDLSSSLSIEKSLGIGTQSPETALDVRGLAKFEHLHVRHKTFKVAGDATQFYPVVFEDLGWASGAMILEISRPDKNMDAEGAGSLLARFTCHASAGHGSEFAHTELHQSHRFIARIRLLPNSRFFIAWLRGERTYHWRTNHESKLINHQAKQKKYANVVLKPLTQVDGSLNRDRLISTTPVYRPTVYGPLTVEGDINYTGFLNKLDTRETDQAIVRSKEFLLGHSSQRGTPGKALVDQKSVLVVNAGNEWSQTRIEGQYTHVKGRLHINAGNIDTSIADSALTTISADQNHALLARPQSGKGGRRLFLELRQEDTNKKTVPEVSTCIRFHHEYRYWHRIEANSGGFHLRDGDLGNEKYVPLFSGNLKVTGSAEVTGNTTVTGNLEVKGTSTFSKNVTASANLNVQGTISATRLELTSSSEHLRLRRVNSEKNGGRVLFLELHQDDTNKKKVPETQPSIRFTHAHRYSHRIEARSGGFYFLSGDLNQDSQWRSVYTGNLNVNGSISTADHGATVLRCADFKMGHKDRRGSPGRALVDIKSGNTTQLHVNYNGDWSQLHLGGKVYAPKETYIGGKPAVAGLAETGLRVIRGTVDASGKRIAGSGFSVGKEGNKWKISFNPDFGSTPTVIATQQHPDNNTSKDGGNTRDNAVVVAVNKAWAYIKTGDGGGDHSWRRFHFIAIST